MANLSNINNKLLVGTNGEVRIGDTATVANVKLRVKQTAQQWTAQFVNTDSSVAYGISIDTSASSYGVAGTLQCYTNTGGGFIVRNDSRVGIGTTSPDSKLDVKGASATPADGNQILSITNTTGGTQLNLGTAENSYGWIEAREGATLRNLLLNPNGGNVGIGTSSPDRSLDVRGTGLSIYGTGDNTELMLRGQVEGTGTVRNVGAFHLSIRSDVGGDNDDLKFLRFVTGTYSGIAMQIQNSTGDIFFANTIVNPASGFSNQKGLGFDGSTGNLEVASTSGTPMTIGRNETAAGEILQLRKESNITHSFGSTDSYLLSNVGIGDTSPQGKLEVNNRNTATGAALFIKGGEDDLNPVAGQYTGLAFGYGGGDIYNNASILWEFTNTAANGKLHFAVNPTAGDGTANLSDSKMTILDSGNVGIGTAGPSAELHVKGDSSSGNLPTVKVESTGSVSYLKFFNSSTGTGSSDGTYIGMNGGTAYLINKEAGNLYLGTGDAINLTLENGGNVGIGTTSPSEKLHIASSAASNLVAKIEQDNASYESWFEANSQNGGLFRAGISTNANNFAFFNTDQASYRWFGAGGGSPMTLTNGKLGIGTTSPAAGLDIKHATAPLITRSTNNNAIAMYNEISGGYSHLYLYQINAGARVVISTNGNSYFNGGNVGIGTTNPSDANLVVKKDGVNTGITNVLMNASFSEGGGVLKGLSIGYRTDETTAVLAPRTATGNLAFYSYDGGWSESMRITNSGNVGIGTTSPASVLHIKDNTAGPTQLSIQSNDFTRAEEINFLNPSTSAISGQIKYYTNPTVEYMSFSTSNNSATVERMRITGSGNVGIGTTSPAEKLSVYNSTAISTVGDVLGVYVAINTPQANKGSAIRIGRDPDGSYSTKIATVYEQSSPSYLNGAMVFYTMNNSYIKGTEVERFRITSAGYLKSLPTYGITTGSAANMHVDSNGIFYRSTSSLKYKTDVRDYDKGLNEVMQLKPKYYKGKDDGNVQFAGLIAEEVHDLGLNEFVQYAKDGTPDALAYPNMIALLTKAIQELEAKIKILENK